MGFWRDLFLGPAVTVAPSLLSPYTPQDSIQTLFVTDAIKSDITPPGAAITRDTALTIPAVKRAHDIVCGVLARSPWAQYENTDRLTPQPSWLVTSKTGVPPRGLRWGVVSDLFMTGWALIGFELGDDGRPVDALHIPHGWWSFDKQAGAIKVSEQINPLYRQRVVPINLGYGSNGIMVDGRDTLADALKILAAYRDRIDNPIASTDLEMTSDRWDMYDDDELDEIRDTYIARRRAADGTVGMHPDFIKVVHSGQLPTDLFESGRNANRLDIANHAGLPASLLEGVRQGGSGGGTDIRYTGVENGGQRNELWDFGLASYADAIQARLSLDDVCPSGQSIRVEAGEFLTSPTPTEPTTSED